MHEPQEVLRILGQRQVRDLGEYRQHLIAAICMGWPPKAMARTGARSERSVYRHLQALTEHVLDPTGVEPTRDFLRTCAELHSACCTAPAFALIKGNRVFDTFRQTGA